jgi:class 3 adenylate cyclase
MGQPHTATTDDLESEELTGLLNHYLTEMSKIALQHGATIDKYVGEDLWVHGLAWSISDACCNGVTVR